MVNPIMSAENLDPKSIEVLARVAHEMRQPLAAATAAVAILDRAEDEERRRKACRVLYHQCARLTRMVDDLLIVNFEHALLCKQHIDLRRVVVDVADACLPLALEKGQQLDLTLPSYACWVHADVIRLEQVFSNVLTNAIKYTDRDGRLSARVAADDGRVKVTMTDSGCGIASELLPHVFEMFTTGSNAGARGLGVGLAVARHLMDLHSGTISVASDGPGCGSEVTITLPVADRIEVREA
jgi:signal transduction histidine kinase